MEVEAAALNTRRRDRNASFIKGMSMNTMAIAVFVIGVGIWTSTFHDQCRKFLTPPIIIIGVVIFLISLIGFLGALKYNPILLWIYLGFLGFFFIVLLVFTAIGFIVTSHDPGHHVDGLRFKEYHLQDCSLWVRKMLSNNHSWGLFKSCFVEPSSCGFLHEVYKTPKKFKFAELSVIAGCCRPPSECGYPAIDASYYNLSSGSISSNKDCKLYMNSGAIKCFDCDACKAGVVQYMKITWRWSLINTGGFLIILILLIYCVCGVRRRAERARRQQATIYPVEVLRRRLQNGV